MGNPGIIEIIDVHKRFQVNNEPLQVLGGLSLTIAPGELVSIVGLSGSGKSTLLRLLIGLDRDYQGEIRVGGELVRGPSLDRGIVFQEHRLFPWLNVRDNVGLGLERSKLSAAEKASAVREHIELVGLGGFEDAFPHQLSGGMAQRAAIARALVNRPSILLLDEPFGALDARTRSNLQQELQRIWQAEKISMVLVTHDVDEAVYLGDRVVVLEPHPGRVERIIPIDVPRPRDRRDARLEELAREVRQAIVEHGN
jgi:ABC-type nitrate/sulfonate/bicarbonate transport system ATPase subunit